MKTIPLWLAALGLLGIAVGAVAQQKPAAAAAGNAAFGGKIFLARCAMCHGKTADGGPMAPSLHGVYRAKAAAGVSPRYSAALKASSLVWTDANLDTFLTAPRKMVPGTNMFVAIPQPADRADVIAHLKTLKK